MLVNVAQDAVDHAGLGDEGDDVHLSAAVTQLWVRFVDAANQLRPCTSGGTPFDW
jgi:hypothetical protein